MVNLTVESFWTVARCSKCRGTVKCDTGAARFVHEHELTTDIANSLRESAFCYRCGRQLGRTDTKARFLCSSCCDDLPPGSIVQPQVAEVRTRFENLMEVMRSGMVGMPYVTEGFEFYPHTRTVIWDGQLYCLTPTQTEIMGIFVWESHKDSHVISQSHAMRRVSRGGRLRDAFRDSPLWKTLIVKVENTDDHYMLNLGGGPQRVFGTRIDPKAS